MDTHVLEPLVARHGTPVLFLSTRRVRDNYHQLQSALSGVDLYYAVKANPQQEILAALEQEGAFFDVCTSGEIEMVKACGIAPERCLHTHPVKTDPEIRRALEFGLELFVADNPLELDKLVPYRDRVKVLIRMSIQNPACLVNLSHKFGVNPADAYDLVAAAAEKGLCVKGLSFHIGSQAENPLKYIEALQYCRDICKKAALAGSPLEIIDIGGGFPTRYLAPVMPLDQFCRPVQEYLERYFRGYRVIAEPGRVICGSTMTLAARIVGKSCREGVWWYYLDEGLYGCFSGKVYDHTDYPVIVSRQGPVQKSVLAGPTCDSTDVVYESIALPQLHVGDVLFFEAMGAYTNASASNFNGFPKAKVVVVD